MVLATIQGKNSQNDQITALNGKIIFGEDEQKQIDDLIDFRSKFKITYKQREEFIKKGNKFFVFLKHIEPDDIGRTRVAMLLYDKNTPKDEIEKTLNVMGLDVANFNNILNKYKTKRVIIGAIICLVVAGVIIYLKRI